MAKSTTQYFTSTAVRDASNVAVPVAAGSFVTADGTASPQTSPLTVSSSVINIAVPTNAVQMIVSNSANALRISDQANASTYFLLPVSTTGFVIDCAKMTNIYLVRDSTDVTVQFMFVVL